MLVRLGSPVWGVLRRGARSAGNAVQRERFRREAAIPAAQGVLPGSPPPLPAQLLGGCILLIALFSCSPLGALRAARHSCNVPLMQRAIFCADGSSCAHCGAMLNRPWFQ